MDMPITRAAAYYKRNRTTHSWYGDSDLMSKSCPSARTLEDHMRQARAAIDVRRAPRRHVSSTSAGHDVTDSAPRPKIVHASPRHRSLTSEPIVIRATQRGPSSIASSPGPSTSARSAASSMQDRPSSAYSYDGGLFISANNAHKDFFVINPEWVSEDQTVKKLSGDAVDGTNAIGTSRKPRRVVTWSSYRRSKSAPPPKHRNPITWI